MTDDSRTPEIPPALSPEEWAQLADWDPQPKDMSNSYLGDSVDGYANDRHALAALCLYEQPFGFRQEDVTRLRDWMADTGIDVFDVAWADSLIARIASLLPAPPA